MTSTLAGNITMEEIAAALVALDEDPSAERIEQLSAALAAAADDDELTHRYMAKPGEAGRADEIGSLVERERRELDARAEIARRGLATAEYLDEYPCDHVVHVLAGSASELLVGFAGAGVVIHMDGESDDEDVDDDIDRTFGSIDAFQAWVVTHQLVLPRAFTEALAARSLPATPSAERIVWEPTLADIAALRGDAYTARWSLSRGHADIEHRVEGRSLSAAVEQLADAGALMDLAGNSAGVYVGSYRLYGPSGAADASTEARASELFDALTNREQFVAPRLHSTGTDRAP